MIKYVKAQKEISYIIVYSFDRFSRTGMSAGKLSEELAERGINVVSATQEIDPSNASGDFQRNLFLIFSAFDNQVRKNRTITGMKEHLLNGYWPWGCPRGYTDLNKYSTADKRQIVVNKEGKVLLLEKSDLVKCLRIHFMLESLYLRC